MTMDQTRQTRDWQAHSRTDVYFAAIGPITTAAGLEAACLERPGIRRWLVTKSYSGDSSSPDSRKWVDLHLCDARPLLWEQLCRELGADLKPESVAAYIRSLTIAAVGWWHAESFDEQIHLPLAEFHALLARHSQSGEFPSVEDVSVFIEISTDTKVILVNFTRQVRALTKRQQQELERLTRALAIGPRQRRHF